MGALRVTRTAAIEPQKETIMTTTTEAKKIQITMSERRPITIVDADWPIIATAFRLNGAVEYELISVREHRDGRRIVYGWPPEGGFIVAPTDELRDADAGPISHVPDDDETVRAIRRVGGIIDSVALANECIADLPAEEL